MSVKAHLEFVADAERACYDNFREGEERPVVLILRGEGVEVQAALTPVGAREVAAVLIEGAEWHETHTQPSDA